jgi:hypothetical protein
MNANRCDWAAATRGAIIPRLAALPGRRPIVAGLILQEIRRSAVKNLLRYVCIDLYNSHNR